MASPGDGRGFLALDSNRGAPDLELAVLDRLEVPAIGAAERDDLALLPLLLKQWRQDGIEFESPAIVVAKRPGGSKRPTRLSPIQATPEP